MQRKWQSRSPEAGRKPFCLQNDKPTVAAASRSPETKAGHHAAFRSSRQDWILFEMQ